MNVVSSAPPRSSVLPFLLRTTSVGNIYNIAFSQRLYKLQKLTPRNAFKMKLALVAVVLVALVLRVALFWGGFHELVKHRVELVTPLTSFVRLQEGVFLRREGLNPYQTEGFHQSPLILILYSHLLSLGSSFVRALTISLDIVNGLLLLRADKLFRRKHSLAAASTRTQLVILSLYYFNPFTVCVCLALSTSVLDNFLLLLALTFASHATVVAVISLAIACLNSIYNYQFLAPIFCFTHKKVLFAVLFIFVLGVLFAECYHTVGSWDFLFSTYGCELGVPDLTPNIGLFWYFFTEIFPQFRTFFIWTLQVHCFSYTLPLWLHLADYPVFFFWMTALLVSTFASYPSYGNTILHLFILPILQPLLHAMKGWFLFIQAYCYVALLGAIFWDLWIYRGSGNSNFFYAINLVYVVLQSFIGIGALNEVMKHKQLKTTDNTA